MAFLMCVTLPRLRAGFFLEAPMPYFDRFDICEAHYVLEADWHIGGVLQERASNRRRRMSTGVQLDRMGFCPGLSIREHGYEALTENGKQIYDCFVQHHGLTEETWLDNPQ